LTGGLNPTRCYNFIMETELEAIRDRVAEFCQERGYDLGPGAEKILADIVRMKETFGEFFCPCREKRTADSICVCKPVRNGLVDMTGSCFCNLIQSRQAKGEKRGR
jgi:ferredoxin-thioredoxin reductase catalytic subunit